MPAKAAAGSLRALAARGAKAVLDVDEDAGGVPDGAPDVASGILKDNGRKPGDVHLGDDGSLGKAAAGAADVGFASKLNALKERLHAARAAGGVGGPLTSAPVAGPGAGPVGLLPTLTYSADQS